MRAKLRLAIPTLALALPLALSLAGCASKPPAADTADAGDEQVNDPYENTNRFFYDVNDTIDR